VKIYISGAIHLQAEAGERFFRRAAERVRIRGHEAVVPHDLSAYHPDAETKCPPSYSEHDGHSAACWLRGDFIELLQCDAILMIGAWQNSVGAGREHDLACWTGMPIYYFADAIPEERT
jgi:uncharacterized protein DUF4406